MGIGVKEVVMAEPSPLVSESVSYQIFVIPPRVTLEGELHKQHPSFAIHIKRPEKTSGNGDCLERLFIKLTRSHLGAQELSFTGVCTDFAGDKTERPFKVGLIFPDTTEEVKGIIEF